MPAPPVKGDAAIHQHELAVIAKEVAQQLDCAQRVIEDERDTGGVYPFAIGTGEAERAEVVEQ